MFHPFRKIWPRERSLAVVSPLLLLLGLWVLAPGWAFAQASDKPSPVSSSKDFEVVDTQYQEFIDRFLQLYQKKNPQQPVSEIETLAQKVAGLGPVEALAAIRANLEVMRRSTSKAQFDSLLHFLYQTNDTATVQVLTEHLKKAGDPAALSRNYFLLAKYYEERQNWQAVQGALSRIDVRNLPIGDSHYYQLLMGYSLQNLKEHRKSLQYYQKIPKESPYFAHAKLNEGTANLRQGWWTEAHMEFERAIEFLTEHARDEVLRNRLLVVLGYSQLHYEFYRDARNTLRKVAVSSASANKALMGIGLAAAYQKDFVGAANAFRLLTEKPVADLSVDEAFLLLPYAHEETGNTEAAGSAYQNAIGHYQRKMDELFKLQNRVLSAGRNQLLEVIQEAEGRADEVFGGATGIPVYMQTNFKNLIQMQMLVGEPDLEKAAQDLLQRYQNHLQNITAQNIEARRAMLNSYLSQAKFGMAKLYDAP